MSTKTEFTIREAKQLFSHPTDDRHIFQFQPFTVRVRAMEDINFHLGCEVTLPDYDADHPNPQMQTECITSFAVLAEAGPAPAFNASGNSGVAQAAAFNPDLPSAGAGGSGASEGAGGAGGASEGAGGGGSS